MSMGERCCDVVLDPKLEATIFPRHTKCKLSAFVNLGLTILFSA